MGSELQTKFQTTRTELTQSLIERDSEIDLVLTGLLSGENVLLVGPPGCAKSLLLDSVMSWMNCRKFSVLLNKFSTPEEVFGPISIAGLKADKYQRVTTEKLPEADLAFVDEIFKASTAILNTLLRVLNEKVFENGEGPKKVPLQLAVAASNEWPSNEGQKELSALFDRFLLRKTVLPIRSQKSRERLLWTESHTPKFSTNLTVAELQQARAEVGVVLWSDDAKECLRTILKECQQEGITCSDRRQFKAVGLCRAYAWLSGSKAVECTHLEVLQHVLWDDPQEQPQKVSQIIAKIANPIGMRLTQHLLEIDEILQAVDMSRMNTIAEAAAKLKLIYEQLTGLTDPSGRVSKVIDYIKTEVKTLKLQAMKGL